ncbi:MAG: PAS domain-containing protein [Spirochaetes bacterium]|nr:PAS domain-containing protein [Spirochaetota bacterium]
MTQEELSARVEAVLARIFPVFFKQSRDGMYITTRAGRFLQANRSLAALLGYTQQELLHIPVEQVYEVPQERRRFSHEIESNGVVHNFRLKLKRKDGQRFTGFVDAVVWRGSDASVAGYVGIVKTEGRVFHTVSEEHTFDLALRGSNDGLWSWDIKNQEITLSSRWKAILGYADYELRDTLKEWTSRIHRDDLPGFKNALESYLRGEREQFSAYFRMPLKTGQYAWMMSRGIGEFDADGRATRIAGSLANVSKHLSIIEKLKKERTELTELTSRLMAERDLLSRYFSQDMISQINSRGHAALESKASAAAILSVRIYDCEHLAERLDPPRFEEFINEFVTDVMDLAYGNGGSVNQILGDSVLCTFGAPIEGPEDLSNCVRCAFEIRDYLDTYNDVRPDFLKSPLEIGIGVAYGTVFSGSIGSVRRLEYTVFGRPVKRASLLHDHCRHVDAKVLADENAVQALGHAVVTEVKPPVAGLTCSALTSRR